MMNPKRQFCRIGVDVGGTNTDAALAVASYHDNNLQPEVQIIASSKQPTTTEATEGIRLAIQDVIQKSKIVTSDILSINIGTTHFINAVVQADVQKLERVAVLRLCGPFCREVPPFTDFPDTLSNIVHGPVGYLDGGLELDGRLISKVNEAQVVEHAKIIASQGIQTVVVSGVFSALDSAIVTQEQQIANTLRREIPGVDVVCSRDVSQGGFLERENASILNAAILKFGRKTISQFERAIDNLGLNCPLYLTQNDGTVLDAYSASQAPIRTFSSGATNSLIGALFLARTSNLLCGIDTEQAQVIMCDIGGTTSDFAALSPSGLPRPSPATVQIGGVRTAFSMPEVVSIGLGGGSILEESSIGNYIVGPKSVGHHLLQSSMCFGGSTLTATDIFVASFGSEKVPGSHSELLSLDDTLIQSARQNIQGQLERGIENMKTSDLPVIMLLVGGGSILVMNDLKNVARCIRPPFLEVANAVGAAIAKVSGEIDTIFVPGEKSQEQLKIDISEQAIQNAIKNGANPESVKVMELELLPLQYISNGAVRVVAKAVGTLGWERSTKNIPRMVNGVASTKPAALDTNATVDRPISLHRPDTYNLEAYKPNVSKASGEWFISPTDLMFIAEGTGILGTGGGGSVYTAYLNSLHTLQSIGGKMRVVDACRLSSHSKVASIAYVGAPSASNERLTGDDELRFACTALAKYEGIDSFSGIMAGEIGGSNGMRTFSTAAVMDIVIVDGDTMGRAFPKVDMCLPYVYRKASPTPAVIGDARGNVQIIAGVDSAARFENIARVISVELGSFAAMAMILSTEVVQQYCCQRSLSLAWYIGRAVGVARSQKRDIIEALTIEVSGLRKLYSGKVTNVSRSVEGGWTIGTATLSPDDESSSSKWSGDDIACDTRELVLQYQNEFLWAGLRDKNSSLEMLCTTPDLITVLDQDGTAISTHELRYGLRLSVISMPADPLWKTDEGMKAGGPTAFGLKMEYKEYGAEWKKPKSVIEEFGV